MNSVSERRLRQLFPDYRPEIAFQAVLTLFRLRVKAQVLLHASLSAFGSYILQAVALGVDTPPQIARILGVEERDIAGPGAELLQAGLVAHGEIAASGQRRLVVTERGRQQLKDGGGLRLPRQRTLQLHFDPLTRQPRPLERNVATLQEIRREGLYVLPYEGHQPTLVELELPAARAAALSGSKKGESFDIVSLLSMQPPYAEYLPGIEVFMLRKAPAKEMRVVALRVGQFQPEISKALQHMHESGISIAPAPAAAALSSPQVPLNVRRLLPPSLAEPAEQLLERNRRVRDLEGEVQQQVAQRSATQSERERQELERRVLQLQEELRSASLERDNLQQQLQVASVGEVRVVRTEEHRELLERALREAQEEVIVISPWMNRHTVDHALCTLIRQALTRGVKVRIGYGYMHERTAGEAERSQRLANEVIHRLREYQRNLRPELLEIVNVRGTHEKVLICDDQFGVATSFNWLSYRGEVDDQYRRETGLVVQSPEAVSRLAEQAREVFAGGVGR